MGNYCISKNNDPEDLVTAAENNERLKNIST